ncbi:hypothetical protein A1Q2_02903 [Trichosporon asahii var. asahii CBS 8904]|uniref:GDT1 family protein n=1 Tax=Trichosporon asahii var. asahii (strain CBS 8904) TaxID=1220162 RepID=K1W1E8_TRIAC|nr:hypothetical protein A1Q2_02903 [Trichosporon asahii var. asahii CBS 8904]
MASRHSRTVVFAGAFASLVVMSVLSAALGKVILGFIPKVWTLWAAAVLFLVFGIKMAQEAREMQASHLQDEMREVEEELEEDTAEHDPNSVQLENLEEGRARPLENSLSAPSRDGSPAPGRTHRSSSRSRTRSLSPSRRMRPSISLGAGVGPLKIKEETMLAWRDTARNALEMMTNPVFAQAFALTFLGEWGDRSQITTIAMAGAHSVPVVAFGTILGHSLCTLLAVMGGRLLSTKLSVKHITMLGALSFICFAVMYAYEAWNLPSEVTI